jgi:hypothetical protein
VWCVRLLVTDRRRPLRFAVFWGVCGSVACGSKAPQPIGVTGTQVPRPPNPAASIVAATPVACGSLELSVAPPPTCEPHTLASTPGGTLTRVWESPCAVSDLRNDGTVDVGNQGEVYAVQGDALALKEMSKLRVDSAFAGSTEAHLWVRKDGQVLLATGSEPRCETLPMPSARYLIAGRRDGHLLYWGLDAGGAKHLVERTVDATWRISPPVPGGDRLYVDLWDQGGRVVAGYQDMAGDATEVGYYDEPSHQLRPIRRGVRASSLQLVPGIAVDEPPTALYMDERKLVIEQPDVEKGYRRIERSLTATACPNPEVADPRNPPSGSFHDQSNPIMFRTNAGALWLAFTETRGRCTYQLALSGPPKNPLRRGRDPANIGAPELFAHPQPEPPRWNVDHLVESAQLILIPIERGRFGDARRADLPRIEPSYAGPWQFHPSVTDARVRIVIGSVVIDLDPNKLTAGPALPRPWIAPAENSAVAVTRVPTPPPANAPPFPALRHGPLATAPTVEAQGERTIETPLYPKPSTVVATCTVMPRTSSSPQQIVRQIVVRCQGAQASQLAVDRGRVVFLQYAQQSGTPIVDIDAKGVVTMHPPKPYPHNNLRIVRGALTFGDDLPPNAPPVPPGYMVYDSDGTSVLAATHNTGYELQRGTVDRTNQYAPVWTWAPAFAGGRTPPKGHGLYWVVLLKRKGLDPTLVYANDPRVAGSVVVRHRSGTIVNLPTWGTGRQSDYRVDELSAVETASETLPIIAAKFDTSLVVAYPSSATGYAMHAIPGNERFDDLAPPRDKPHAGEKCATSVVEREREELYGPQLFTWGKEVGLAYLSTRVRERARWTQVPPACGWVIDERETVNELAVARVDKTGATELMRVPVEYKGGPGINVVDLLVAVEGKTLHTLATSYGVTTYTQIALP